jgi:hypothetical protein
MKMKLIESIASYTGKSRKRMEEVLNNDVKEIIAKVVRSQEDTSNIDNALLEELMEMDVFKYYDGQIKPNTAIFFKEDIERMYTPIFMMGEQLAEITNTVGNELKNYSPNIRNFIGSIMGMGQGLHTALKNMNLALNWQNKTGKYEKSKVDFNEECQAYFNFGEDLQIKRVHRGNRYTSVIIGSGTEDYCSYLWNAKRNYANTEIHGFYDNLVNYLTDTLPLLISREIYDESLAKAAQIAHIDIDDASSVISVDDAQKYEPIINKISNECTLYFLDNIGQVHELLMSTIVGQQGVPPENMMMNFWRYLRKSVAMNLYKNGFLNDKVPQNGQITIFYENDIDFF